MASAGEKSLAVGHIPGFQIDPKETLNKSSSAGGESFAASFLRFIQSFLKKAKTSAGYPAVQIDIRLILWQMRDRPKRETRILVQLNKGIRCKTGTRRADPSCCKHGADFLSAKAGHWGNLRRREAAWTISSERVSQKTYKLCV